MEAANVNLELHDVNAQLGPCFYAIRCPVRYTLGTGSPMGSSESAMRDRRASVDTIVAEHGNVAATVVPCNHAQFLARAADAVATAIRDLAVRSAIAG